MRRIFRKVALAPKRTSRGNSNLLQSLKFDTQLAKMRMPNRPNYAQIYADSEISFLYNNEDNIAYEKEINHLAAEIQQMNDEKMKKLLRLRELTDRLLRGLNYLDIEQARGVLKSLAPQEKIAYKLSLLSLKRTIRVQLDRKVEQSFVVSSALSLLCQLQEACKIKKADQL